MRNTMDMFPAEAAVNARAGSGRMSRRDRDIITEEFDVPGALCIRMR